LEIDPVEKRRARSVWDMSPGRKSFSERDRVPGCGLTIQDEEAEHKAFDPVKIGPHSSPKEVRAALLWRYANAIYKEYWDKNKSKDEKKE